MTKKIYKFMLLFLLLYSLFVTVSCRNKKNPDLLKKEIIVEKQTQDNRIYEENVLNFIKEIKYTELKDDLYKPSELRIDANNNIFIFDIAVTKIHKIKLSIVQKDFLHQFSKKIRGQGPGEINRLLDFKLFHNQLFLVDGVSNSIKKYSIDGNHIIDLRLPDNKSVLIHKLTLIKDKLIVGTLSPDTLFVKYKKTGEFEKYFGHKVDLNNLDNLLYHQYHISSSVNNSEYFHLFIHLGFVSKYKDETLLFARETIDGRQFPKFYSESSGSGVTTRPKGLPLLTIHSYALNKEIMLVKAVNLEKRLAFWDVYRTNDFKYLFSIKNPPATYCFDLNNDVLVVAGAESLKVYGLKRLFRLVKDQLE